MGGIALKRGTQTLMKGNNMNKKQKLFAGFLVLFLIVFIGVGCIQNAIVPCEIDQDVIAYTGEPPTIYVPWTTIHDGNRIRRKMEYIHLTKQETAKRLSEDDNMFYDYINNNMTINLENAQQIKDAVFDPAGPLALMFPALAGLGLGRYMRSPREKKLEKQMNGNSKSTTT